MNELPVSIPCSPIDCFGLEQNVQRQFRHGKLIYTLVILLTSYILLMEGYVRGDFSRDVLFSLRTLQPDGGTEKVSKCEEIM